MLKLDFFNESYSLEEIIDVFTDGSLDNFKGDEDFLTFLISYSLGDDLEGPDADKYKEFAKYEGIFNIMQLDSYDYFGQKLYKIYEICGKNKMDFMQVCDLIGHYGFKQTLDKHTIDTNLQLKEPVSFLDDTIVLSNGKKIKYDPEKRFVFRNGLEFQEELEYDHEIERSLRHRINISIKENKDEVELLEEMPSYVDKERLEKEAEESKKVKDDHMVDINNLFFGTQNLDVSGGVLGIHVSSVSWFEYTNIDMLNYHVFRSIPEGDYCLLDDEGQIHIPDEVFKKNDISIGPNSRIRSVNISNVPSIFNNAIKRLEENPIENEEVILNAKGLFEILQDKEQISVGEIKNYEDVIRGLYEVAYGEMFDNKDGDYKVDASQNDIGGNDYDIGSEENKNKK